MKTKNWKEIKDNIYGKKGTERRDGLERDFEVFRIGVLLKRKRSIFLKKSEDISK
jgi:hypothetical protein